MDEKGTDEPEPEAEKEQEWLGHAAGPNLRSTGGRSFLGRGLGLVGGGSMGVSGHGRTAPTPEQLRQMGAAEQDYLAEHEAVESARYEALTPAERDKVYVHPGVLQRIKQWMFGV